MEDFEIVQLYFQRNERAIRETEVKYGAYCYAIARNILTVEEDAQECVNDTYYRAWISIPPNAPDNLRVWLAKVIRNISINLWNKNHAKKRYKGLEVLLSELEECVPSAINLERQLADEEVGKIISNWLRKLSEMDRRIFLQRYFEGKMVKQIAKTANLEPKRVSKKLFLLRGQLKEFLEEEGVVL